jgi:heat shock protein HspQ
MPLRLMFWEVLGQALMANPIMGVSENRTKLISEEVNLLFPPQVRDCGAKLGGEIGIRTLGTVAGTPHFECGAFDHSAISPRAWNAQGLAPLVFAKSALSLCPSACQGVLARGGKEPYLQMMTHVIHTANRLPAAGVPPIASARFGIGEVVRHRVFDFRGVIFDIDPVFANSDEWYDSIPAEVRPRKDQPFYHLLAENAENSYVAYVSQQNLLHDDDNGPVSHPAIEGIFNPFSDGRYQLKPVHRH